MPFKIAPPRLLAASCLSLGFVCLTLLPLYLIFDVNKPLNCIMLVQYSCHQLWHVWRLQNILQKTWLIWHCYICFGSFPFFPTWSTLGHTSSLTMWYDLQEFCSVTVLHGLQHVLGVWYYYFTNCFFKHLIKINIIFFMHVFCCFVCLNMWITMLKSILLCRVCDQYTHAPHVMLLLYNWAKVVFPVTLNGLLIVLWKLLL